MTTPSAILGGVRTLLTFAKNLLLWTLSVAAVILLFTLAIAAFTNPMNFFAVIIIGGVLYAAAVGFREWRDERR